MDECFCPGADIPIRQGDIFLWEKDATPGDVRWPQMGVILTADCDIANNKFGGFLTCVPVLSLHNYINDVLIINKLEKQYEKHIESVVSLVHKFHIQKNPGAKRLTRNSLEQWLSRKGSSQISDELCIGEGKQRVAFEKACEIACSCLVALQSSAPLEVVQSLVELHKYKSNSNTKESNKQIRTQIGYDAKRPAQDIFFISAIPDVEELGFMVMLRHIRPVSIGSLTTSVQDKQVDSRKALRIARLHDVYKYAMTQQFAMLFSRIGLSAAYEDSRELVVDDFVEIHLKKLIEGN